MKRLIVSEYMIPGEPFEIRIAKTPGGWIDAFWYIYRKWEDNEKYFRVKGDCLLGSIPGHVHHWAKNFPTQFKTAKEAREAWEKSKK